MDMEKIEAAATASSNLTETFAFKLSLEQKEEFVELCRVKGFSTGGVCRELLSQFISEVKKNG